MPASRNHRPKEEKISNNGMPAEMPRNNMVITRGCENARNDCNQLVLDMDSDIIQVFKDRNQ
jgi:hypothetical protein